MAETNRKELEWWFAEFCSEDQVDKYLSIFPEFNTRLSKFGIFIWNMTGMIDIENPNHVSLVRNILRALDHTPCFEYFVNSFDEKTPEDVIAILQDRFGILLPHLIEN